MLELDVVGIEVREPGVESVDNGNSIPIPVHVAVSLRHALLCVEADQASNLSWFDRRGYLIPE